MFFKDKVISSENGAIATEYALISALLVVAILLSVVKFAGNITQWWSDICSKLTTVFIS